jgi:asparagine N-glycosylation enzyme membrane subunit Stt3
MASRLRRVSSAKAIGDERTALAAGAAALLASGFVFRRIARSARGILPDPIAHAAVAAAGTWALAKALEAAESRLSSDE